MDRSGAASIEAQATRGDTICPVLVSASRRTDIPQFYGAWFAQRLKDGIATFRTAFGTPGRVSLRRGDVLGFLFWTKYAGPFRTVLEELRAEAVPFAFQYTVNGYGTTLERNIPPLAQVLRDVLAVRALLPSAACLEWRYDPIILSEAQPVPWHLRHFTRLARAMDGVVDVVNVSVVEPYAKTVRRMAGAAAGVRFRAGRTRNAGSPEDSGAGEDTAALLGELGGIAAQLGIELRVCSNPEWRLPVSRCVSAELFSPWGRAADAILTLAPRPSRPGCHCLAVVDIGMDNTCLGGCRYCYATVSDGIAQSNFACHDPARTCLR